MDINIDQFPIVNLQSSFILQILDFSHNVLPSLGEKMRINTAVLDTKSFEGRGVALNKFDEPQGGYLSAAELDASKSVILDVGRHRKKERHTM
jgi:hypothetical protein